MSCRVLFFPLKYIPCDDDLIDLDKIQGNLSFHNAEIIRDCANDYDKAVRLQNIANIFRDRWEIIDCESEI